MNILIIAPTPYFSDRGCHIRILEEIKALKQAGHNPILYTYHLGRDLGDVQTYRSVNIPWYNKISAGFSWHKIYLDILLLLKIVFNCRKHSFDIIHAHLHEGAFLGYWVKLFLRKPLILDAQDSLTEELQHYNVIKSHVLKKLVFALERWIVNRADHVFTSSLDLLSFMQEYFPEAKNKLSLLPDAATQSPTVLAEQQRQELAVLLNINLQKPVIIYTGGLTPTKGIDYLLDAIPLVVKKQPDAQFVLIGYPLNHVIKRVEKLGIASALRIVGKVDYSTLFHYLQLADIAVDPKPASSSEASGKMINYMAAGLPVVAFDTVRAHETLVNAGVVTKENNAAGLAEAIIELLNNPAEQKRLGELAKKLALERYSWKTIIQQAIQYYEQLAK
ncbi:MAG: glycosyltransferase family 4 protein [Patescibacteria group bacterium]|jgi:glycosyltransferase involved in cell wall biosynthesis